MTAQDKTTIKSYFQTNDRPAQSDFENLIDSYQDASPILNYIVTASPGLGYGYFLGTTGSGAAYFGNSVIRVSSNGTVRIPSISIGAIEDTAIGQLTPAAGNFTNITTVNNFRTSGDVSAARVYADDHIRTNTLKVLDIVSANTLYADSGTISGSLTAGTITDYHSLYVKEVVADEYDIVLNAPYAYSVNQFRGSTKDGNCRVLFKSNGTTFFTQVFASGSTTISTTKSFAVGDHFTATVSAVSGAVSGLAIYPRITRAL